MGLMVSIDPNDERPTSLTLPAATTDAAIAQLRAELDQLLNLAPNRIAFRVSSLRNINAGDQLALNGRSLMAVFFLLSQAVEPPVAHLEKNLLTITQTMTQTPFDWSSVTGKLLRVKSGNTRPAEAYAAVRYRDAWFYIEDTDLNSKATLGLLNLLFSLQSVSGTSNSPLLTLPAGG